MARRPRGSARWLREALVARRTRLVDRFDCPGTRLHLAEYVERVESGAVLDLSAEELFLALFPLDPDAADTFTRARRGPRGYRLTGEDRLEPVADRR